MMHALYDQICSICPLFSMHTHTIYRLCIFLHQHSIHSRPAGPHTLASLGGGASEYTVVVWPWAPAWLASPLDSVSRGAFGPGYTIFFYLQLNSSCTNTYTLKQVCINDFMLEPFCFGCSDILRSGRRPL